MFYFVVPFQVCLTSEHSFTIVASVRDAIVNITFVVSKTLQGFEYFVAFITLKNCKRSLFHVEITMSITMIFVKISEPGKNWGERESKKTN